MKIARIVSLSLAFATSLGLAACAAPAPADDQAGADGPLAEAGEELILSTIFDTQVFCQVTTTCRSFCLSGESDQTPNFCGSGLRLCGLTQCASANTTRIGFIKNAAGGGCLAKDSAGTLRPCNSDLPARLWRFEDNLIKSQDAQCLSADNATGLVSIKLCANASRWVFDTDNSTFRLLGTNKCLFGKVDGAPGDGVDVRDCGIQGPRFQWGLVKP